MWCLKMSAREKLLKLVEALTGDVGRKVFEVLLEHSGEMSDEEIAQAVNLRINDVRKVLYELAKYGMVSYKRISTRDSLWYSYKWYIDEDALMRTLLQRKKSVLKKLEERLAYEESGVFYVCPVDGSRYSFDEAFENYFKCPRCGSDLVEVNNDAVVEYLRRLIDKLRQEIEEDERNISSRPV